MSFAEPQATEYQLKAALLGNIAKFVEWPAGGLATNSRFVVGVFGSDPFGSDLETILRAVSVQGHPVIVKRASGITSLLDCQLIFVSRTETDRFRDAVPTIASRPILTIGEETAFLDAGGMVALVLDGRRVRFEVNLGPASRCGISFNSQLLRLAQAVKRNGKSP